ncbi:hypothetical protein BC939DRAFT_480369 [Gamsiella multidivaricata]|uniref:uncharacterized protein n=1 Tax=Gamsiella multidivaricata TaxID=101098 RepID=UPI00221F49F2|nr:uncharacterized protein BC939DRAFT_480369 [Gamsiella multidivaricata]KAI7818481.1 hypothetical protein BC939DRAFT_480369 [Gamsiella multidivaricata]
MENIDGFGPPPQQTISQHLAIQLQASRAGEQAARAQMEIAKKRAREEAIAEGFEKYQRDLETLWVELGNVVHHQTNRKSRKCALEHMQGVTATLRFAIFESIANIDMDVSSWLQWFLVEFDNRRCKKTRQRACVDTTSPNCSANFCKNDKAQ